MKVAATIARILLGLLFVVAGAGSLLHAPPPEPGLAGQFDAVAYASHFMDFVSAAQLLLGALLLVNRFVPVALILLAAFLYNSLAFHITMAQSTVLAPLAVSALWLVISLQYRALFAPLFAARPNKTPNEAPRRERLTPIA